MPTILGTSGDDILLGTGGDDTIIGRGGFDTIDGGDGNDVLKGGGDDDTISGGIGNDAITGGAGNDSIDAGSGDNVVDGGSGNDQIYAAEGNDTITGGQGYDYIDAGTGNNVINSGADDDSVYTGDGNDTVNGGDGNDYIYDGGGSNVINGGDGNDTVNISSNGANTIHGGAGNDQVTTGNGNDVIYGGQGNDVINAADGDNTIYGGAGDDTINTGPGWFTPSNNNIVDGGDGNDTIFTGFGNDIINGGAGDDNIFGYMGYDTIHGGLGNDTISVQSGMSLMYGDQGDDQITGGYEQDTIRGGQGNDTINGLEGADDIEGGQGNDVIAGGTGNDVIDGGEGNDTILGESGDDTIRGGGGDDVLDGGAGSDTLIGNLDSDVLTYKAGENGGAHDVYDGRKGNDTLRLVLTETQAANAAADLQAFQDFLAANADPDSNSGATFQFNSFDLQVRNVEALDLIVEPDPAPTGYTLVSGNAAGQVGQGEPLAYVQNPFALSADGRYVAFTTQAGGLTPDDNDTGDFIEQADLFIKDTQTGAITRIDTRYNVGDTIGISDDGRYVTYQSKFDGLVRTDLQTNTTIQVVTDASGTYIGQGEATVSMSADGERIAFMSYQDILTGDTNGRPDVYVKDLSTGDIVLASTDASGASANEESGDAMISGDGRYVVFTSGADNLVADDTNGVNDIFVKDLQTGGIVRANTDASGNQAIGGYSSQASISADGRYVTFISGATNLDSTTPNVTTGGVYRKDLQTGDVVRVDSDANGNTADQYALNFDPHISGDGRFVVFFSGDDLTPGDNNGRGDIFVKDIDTGAIAIVTTDGVLGNDGNPGFNSAFSSDGSQIVFWSAATDLVANDTNNHADVFMFANPFG